MTNRNDQALPYLHAEGINAQGRLPESRRRQEFDP